MRGKADGIDALEGSSPETRYGKCAGHHRSQRPGHVFKGVTWELERANCLLSKLPECQEVNRFTKRPGVEKLLPLVSEPKGTRNKDSREGIVNR